MGNANGTTRSLLAIAFERRTLIQCGSLVKHGHMIHALLAGCPPHHSALLLQERCNPPLALAAPLCRLLCPGIGARPAASALPWVLRLARRAASCHPRCRRAGPRAGPQQAAQLNLFEDPSLLLQVHSRQQGIALASFLLPLLHTAAAAWGVAAALPCRCTTCTRRRSWLAHGRGRWLCVRLLLLLLLLLLLPLSRRGLSRHRCRCCMGRRGWTARWALCLLCLLLLLLCGKAELCRAF